MMERQATMFDAALDQSEMLLDHLRHRGPITALDALNTYGIGRLAARIKDLKNKGYTIYKKNRGVTKANGKKAVVAEYFI